MSSTTSATTVSEVKVSPAPAIITLAGKVAIVTGASRYHCSHIPVLISWLMLWDRR
jgi:hypothetical protein